MTPAAQSAAVACAGLMAGLAACAPQGGPAEGGGPAHPPGDYLGAEVTALDDDLVRVRAGMKHVRTRDEIAEYARCAVARHARDKGYGFARHVRTNVDEKGGVSRADAVYTISPTLPRGLVTIDAEVTVAECAEEGVPTE